MRRLAFIASAVTLTLIAIGSGAHLVECLGGDTLRMVWEDPRLLIDGYHGILGDMGFNYDWFARRGPMIVIASLVSILVVSR